MEKVIVKNRNQLNDLYNSSALTIEGLDPSDESLGQFKGVLEEAGAWHEDSCFYITKGKVMNAAYKLHGRNAYPDDCSIVSAMNIDLGKVVFLRFQFGGRWFDDIVENNAQREGSRGISGIFLTNLNTEIA